MRKNTAVRVGEVTAWQSFVKTIKRDYISIMPKPDGLTARTLQRRSSIITNGIRIVLGYRSPREYLRQQASNGLSD